MKIYHNPRCSKSREALALIEAKGVDVVVIDYLQNPPSVPELKDILKKLNMRPRDIVRTKEDEFNKLQLNLEDDAAVLDALVTHPRLIERPIVVNGSAAVIGRPPENVRALF